MMRLIRKDSTIDYCSIWTRGLTAVVHAGRVGDRATVHESLAADSQQLSELVASQIASARAIGFRELQDADVQDLVVQFSDQDFPPDEMLAHRHLLEERAAEALGWVGAGYSTGGDISPSRVNVWCKVIDPEVAAEAILSDLEALGLDEGIVIAVRIGTSYEVMYPFDYQHAFQL